MALKEPNLLVICFNKNLHEIALLAENDLLPLFEDFFFEHIGFDRIKSFHQLNFAHLGKTFRNHHIRSGRPSVMFLEDLFLHIFGQE